ncbi:hypothetical protein PG994_004332 [Apiospora phragmitis]|uniref:Uncharacterized protein n=1 Tax=Apiospora phragmitis TaxID=2905665 RepID=A0ABR1VQE9_9PEZI
MSSAYRYGTWDGAWNGETASEIAQAKARRKKKSEEARRAYQEKMAAEQHQRTLSDNEKVQSLLAPYVAEVNLQRQYQKQMPKKLLDYHEKPEGTAITSADWKASYQDIGHFLTAALLAYHYQLDCEKGTVRGPNLYQYRDHAIRLDIPYDYSLNAYFRHRGLAATDGELKYFEGSISKKASYQPRLLPSPSSVKKWHDMPWWPPIV